MNRIRKYYSTMDKGEKSYMANKLFKEDSIVAAKVKVYIPDEILYPVVEPTFRKGDRFNIEGEKFILAQVGSGMACLVSLENGNYWSTAKKVDKMSAITAVELAHVADYTVIKRISKMGENV